MDGENREELSVKFETKSINYFNGCLQLPIPVSAIAEAGKLQQACNGGKTLTVEVKVKRNTRSNNANSYCWALCTEIAKVIRSSKHEVYQQAIRSIGAFTPNLIREDAVERYTEHWQSHGVGWLVENMGRSSFPGYVVLACYHGSSAYDTKEMSQLIDWLIDEAKGIGIDVISDADRALLLEDWHETDKKKTI